jgi:hypothetical protein
MTDNITLPRATVQQIRSVLRVAVTPLPQDRREILRLDLALRTALEQPILTHRITSWGHCGVCRHDRIPGEGCARQECPDSPQQQAESVAYDKTEINCFVQDLYDEKMQEGKHGHYETMFYVVHQAIKKVAPPAAQPEQEPVADGNKVICPACCHQFRAIPTAVQTLMLNVGFEPPFVTPPAAQRPWVGLTDEEMSDTVADMEVDFGDLLWKVVCLTKLIEAKLKERNGY